MAGLAVATLVLADSARRVPDLLGAFRLWLPLLAACVLGFLAWWRREHRLRLQQSHQRVLHTLAEDIIAAPTPEVIAEKLATVLPSVTEATGVNLYLYKRGTRSLERIPTSLEPEPMAASVDSSPEGLAGAAVVCLRNRTLLNIPDVHSNPLVKVGAKMSLPRSAMFVPLYSQQGMLGVLELSNVRKAGFFRPEEQAEAQHLANQTAAALRLQERQSTREQLFQSEKLATTGRLISGVAGELSAPIGNIVKLAAALAARPEGPPSPSNLAKLTAESSRAAEIVSRLVSFGRDDDQPPTIIDINAIAAEMLRFREPGWKNSAIQAQDRLSKEPAPVLGTQSQIEQVLLNLLVQAEHHAARSAARTLSLHSSVIGRKVLVDIEYATAGDEDALADPFASATMVEGSSLGLGVCQGIVRGNGGEIRFRSRTGLANFELELPLSQSEVKIPSRVDTGKPARPLTILLVDADASSRSFLELLAARRHRGVPVAGREAKDISQRLRFDGVFWFVSPGGPSWTEFIESFHGKAPPFVLVSDAWDAALARRMEETRSFLLARPIQEADLERILSTIEIRSGTPV